MLYTYYHPEIPIQSTHPLIAPKVLHPSLTCYFVNILDISILVHKSFDKRNDADFVCTLLLGYVNNFDDDDDSDGWKTDSWGYAEKNGKKVLFPPGGTTTMQMKRMKEGGRLTRMETLTQRQSGTSFLEGAWTQVMLLSMIGSLVKQQQYITIEL